MFFIFISWTPWGLIIIFTWFPLEMGFALIPALKCDNDKKRKKENQKKKNPERFWFKIHLKCYMEKLIQTETLPECIVMSLILIANRNFLLSDLLYYVIMCVSIAALTQRSNNDTQRKRSSTPSIQIIYLFLL